MLPEDRNKLTSFTCAVGGGVKVLFESHLGTADFLLPNNSCILYVSECDVIAGSSFRRKLARHRNVSCTHRPLLFLLLFFSCPCADVSHAHSVLQSSSRLQALVLVENTRLSEQYFTAVQKFVVFDLGLTLLPVGGQTEAAQLITQVVSSRKETRTFILTRGPSSEWNQLWRIPYVELIVRSFYLKQTH